jgi:hypothetical protein
VAAWCHILALRNVLSIGPIDSYAPIESIGKARDEVTIRTYHTQANAPAGVTRARVVDLGSCPAVLAPWSPTFIGTAMATKHGRPRRTPVSPT